MLIICLVVAAGVLLSVLAGEPPEQVVLMALNWLGLALFWWYSARAERRRTAVARLLGLTLVTDSAMDRALLGAARLRTTADLIEMHDEGVRLGNPPPSIMRAIETVLRDRCIVLCPCGAPPRTTHPRDCEAKR